MGLLSLNSVLPHFGMPRPIHITEIGAYPLNVPLPAPFAVASTRLDVVENIAISVALSDGTVGWGEASTLQPITVENQELALSTVHHAEDWLVGYAVKDWEHLAVRLAEQLPGQASSRAFQARPTAEHQGIMLPHDIQLIEFSTIRQPLTMCFSQVQLHHISVQSLTKGT